MLISNTVEDEAGVELLYWRCFNLFNELAYRCVWLPPVNAGHTLTSDFVSGN